MRGWDGTDRACLPGLVFDDTSSLLCFSSPVGIKVASVATGETLRVHGKSEQGDFYLQLAILQNSESQPGGTSKQSATTSSTKKSAFDGLPDPLILATASTKLRFYTFSRREPSDTEIDKVGRDLMNERLNNAAGAQSNQQKQAKEVTLPDKAVIYTSMGEIHLELYG